MNAIARRISESMQTMCIGRSAGAAADLSRRRLFLEEPFVKPTTGQVFWLPDLTTFCTFPRQVLNRAAKYGSPGKLHAVAVADFVPGYSGGTATDSHRLPYSSPPATSRERHPGLARRWPRGPLRTASW